MKITKFLIKNFRSFSPTNDRWIDCSDINVFIGQGDTGKSNALAALDLYFNGGFVTFYDFFDPSQAIKIEIEIDDIPHDTLIFNPLEKGKDKSPASKGIHSLSIPRFVLIQATRDWSQRDTMASTKSGLGKVLTKALKETWVKDIQTLANSKFNVASKPLLDQVITNFQVIAPDILTEAKIDFVVDWNSQTIDKMMIVKRLGRDIPVSNLGSGSRSRLVTSLDLFDEKIILSDEEPLKDVIIALEEPEVHLFPGAIKSMAEKLFQLGGQIFFSTHSPVLVNMAQNRDGIITLFELDISTRATIIWNQARNLINQIVANLGVSLSDVILFGDHNTIVEGKLDKKIIIAVVDSGVFGKRTIHTNFIIAFTAAQAPNIATVLKGYNLSFNAVLDHDTAGNKAVSKMDNTPPSDIVQLASNTGEVIEDMFSEDFVVEGVNILLNKERLIDVKHPLFTVQDANDQNTSEPSFFKKLESLFNTRYKDKDIAWDEFKTEIVSSILNLPELSAEVKLHKEKWQPLVETISVLI